jgi:hypothetical protein
MTDLHPTNHELMELVRARIDCGYPMTGIARELGYDVDELCNWIMCIYREPKKRRQPYVNRMSEPVAYSAPSRSPLSTRGDAQRLANWKRQREAAAAARASIAIEPRQMTRDEERAARRRETA